MIYSKPELNTISSMVSEFCIDGSGAGVGGNCTAGTNHGEFCTAGAVGSSSCNGGGQAIHICSAGTQYLTCAAGSGVKGDGCGTGNGPS